MEYKIREMLGSDMEDIINLLKVCELYYPEDDTPSKLKNKLQIDRDLMLVAVSEDKIIGFIMANYDRWVASIWHLGVLPEFRSNGIARSLMLEIQRRLKVRGADLVYGFVRLKNNNMRQIVSKWGFTEGAEVAVICKRL